jgi:hypothetical protein
LNGLQRIQQVEPWRTLLVGRPNLAIAQPAP